VSDLSAMPAVFVFAAFAFSTFPFPLLLPFMTKDMMASNCSDNFP